MTKLVDVADLKSAGSKTPYRFDSGSRDQKHLTRTVMSCAGFCYRAAPRGVPPALLFTPSGQPRSRTGFCCPRKTHSPPSRIPPLERHTTVQSQRTTSLLFMSDLTVPPPRHHHARSCVPLRSHAACHHTTLNHVRMPPAWSIPLTAVCSPYGRSTTITLPDQSTKGAPLH